MRNVRRHLITFATASMLTAGPLHAFASEADQANFTQVERGRALATASDCVSCHTAPGSGQPFAGDRPIETPFGNIVAPNITPDLETGIGAWSDEQFDDALRKGIGRNGAHLYPAMPYTAYTKLSRDDVLAIRAYLNTVMPIRKVAQRNTLPFPFNIRSVMIVWNALYFKEGEFKPDSNQSAEWNRGAFLVIGPAHCGACHTPKSILGGDKTNEFLQGAFLQGWSAPNIINDTTTGLGNWSNDDITAYLKTGHHRITAATGPMAEVVSLSTSQMTDSDVQAIAVYLKSLNSDSKQASAIKIDDPVIAAGGAIYRDQCSACHALDGKGVSNLFPSLAESSMARSADPTSAIRIVLRGARSVATGKEPTGPGMPSYAHQLNDTQIAAVLTYIRNGWGNAAPAVTDGDVSKVRSATAWRPD